MSAQPQHLEALDKGNRIRLERAALREWVREPADPTASRERLASIVDEPIPENLASLQLEKFLRWGWKMVPSRISGVYRLAECTGFKALGDLTDRQRVIVARALRASSADLETAKGEHEFARWMRRAA